MDRQIGGYIWQFTSEAECQRFIQLEQAQGRLPSESNPRCQRIEDKDGNGQWYVYATHVLLTVPHTSQPQISRDEDSAYQLILDGIAGDPEDTNPTVTNGDDLGRSRHEWFIYVIRQPYVIRQGDQTVQLQPPDFSCRPPGPGLGGPGGPGGPGPGLGGAGISSDYQLENYEDYNYQATLPPCTTVQPPVETTTCIDYFYGAVTTCSVANGHEETKKHKPKKRFPWVEPGSFNKPKNFDSEEECLHYMREVEGLPDLAQLDLEPLCDHNGTSWSISVLKEILNEPASDEPRIFQSKAAVQEYYKSLPDDDDTNPSIFGSRVSKTWVIYVIRQPDIAEQPIQQARTPISSWTKREAN